MATWTPLNRSPRRLAPVALATRRDRPRTLLGRPTTGTRAKRRPATRSGGWHGHVRVAMSGEAGAIPTWPRGRDHATRPPQEKGKAAPLAAGRGSGIGFDGRWIGRGDGQGGGARWRIRRAAEAGGRSPTR